MPFNKDIPEPHPLFPSGEWEGFYTYASGPHAGKHPMAFTLTFSEGQIVGLGSDEVGGFSWKGEYDTEDLWCKMVKFYLGHAVLYKGEVDENGIWGKWMISSFSSGGFHIWQKELQAREAMKAKKEAPIEEYLPISL